MLTVWFKTVEGVVLCRTQATTIAQAKRKAAAGLRGSQDGASHAVITGIFGGPDLIGRVAVSGGRMIWYSGYA